MVFAIRAAWSGSPEVTRTEMMFVSPTCSESTCPARPLMMETRRLFLAISSEESIKSMVGVTILVAWVRFYLYHDWAAHRQIG